MSLTIPKCANSSLIDSKNIRFAVLAHMKDAVNRGTLSRTLTTRLGGAASSSTEIVGDTSHWRNVSSPTDSDSDSESSPKPRRIAGASHHFLDENQDEMTEASPAAAFAQRCVGMIICLDSLALIHVIMSTKYDSTTI